jgi:hypothetical protein
MKAASAMKEIQMQSDLVASQESSWLHLIWGSKTAHQDVPFPGRENYQKPTHPHPLNRHRSMLLGC